MCLCTMRESCSDCESNDWQAQDLPVKKSKFNFKFGQEVFVVNDNEEIVKALFCGMDQYESDMTVRMQDGTLETVYTRSDETGVFQSETDAAEFIKACKTKELKRKIENYTEKIQDFKDWLAEAEAELHLLLKVEPK